MRDVCITASLSGLQLKNPTMLASGILGYSSDMFENIAKCGAGAVVSKSIGLKPRAGYPNPTIVQANCGFINAMGLPNPGMDEFVKEIREAKAVLEIPLIVSVYGYSADEYGRLTKQAIDAGADAVELNVSCPHVKETGSEIGQNPTILAEVVARARTSTSKPLFVKLSPNVTNITEIARIAEEAGADALTIMNAVRALAIDIETTLPILANKTGGLSGPAVKPIALRLVYEVYEHVKVPIIGCGGVTDWRDAVEFLLAGATAVQVGSAVAIRGCNIFRELTRGMAAYVKKKGLNSVREIVGLSHRC